MTSPNAIQMSQGPKDMSRIDSAAEQLVYRQDRQGVGVQYLY